MHKASKLWLLHMNKVKTTIISYCGGGKPSSPDLATGTWPFTYQCCDVLICGNQTVQIYPILEQYSAGSLFPKARKMIRGFK